MKIIMISLILVASTGSVIASECPGDEMVNGWCWPTGEDNTDGYYGWHNENSAYAGNHLAQDIGATEGESIYAIADGNVIDVNMTVADYGGVNISGGGVIIDHGTVDGERFETLSAHMKNLLVSSGDKVVKGQKIGEVGSYYLADGSRVDHLHFGLINPSKGKLNAHRWTGYWSTNVGFTDPITFLNSHSPAITPTTTSTCGNSTCDIDSQTFSNGDMVGWYPQGYCDAATQWFSLGEVDGSIQPIQSLQLGDVCICR